MLQKLDHRQSSLMVLLSVKQRGERRGKILTRARFSELTLKRLCLRETIDALWLSQVNEYLLAAGWLLFYAGTTYAAVKIDVVENWPRAVSKHLTELEDVKAGKFDFAKLEPLLDKASWKTTSHLQTARKKRAKKASPQ